MTNAPSEGLIVTLFALLGLALSHDARKRRQPLHLGADIRLDVRIMGG